MGFSIGEKRFEWNPKKSLTLGKKRKPSKSIKSPYNKLPTWTHVFVCLANPEQEAIPDSSERERLQAACLGEEKKCFLENAEAWEILQNLEEKFPKLCGCGGYEFLGCSEGGAKTLQPIARPKNGYTVKYLRAVVHHAKI